MTPASERAAAARPVVAALADAGHWDAVAEANASVKTTLGRLGVDDAARLVWHSYVLTWINLWVVHGVAPPPDPAKVSLARFTQLCQPATDGAP